MSKYQPIADFLARQTKSHVRVRFSRIEQLIGTKLPQSARQHSEWWANNSDSHPWARMWLSTGWQTGEVDRLGESVGFRRVAGGRRSQRRRELPSWILIHSPERYDGADPDNPKDELALKWPDKDWDRLWHWKRSKPMREDDRPRTILLAWKKYVFAEATATVTQNISHENPKSFNFAFKLLNYQPLRWPIPLRALRLGNREHSHRDLIRLSEKDWKAYRAAQSGRARKIPANVLPESVQFESEIESTVNPHKGRRQGFGLTAQERKSVELHAMASAEAYLAREGFAVEDVSNFKPFDILATRSGESVSVEVKGTTGLGSEILLTNNEVQFQRISHPANMLIVVHSIRLTRGTDPRTSGGELRVIFPWPLGAANLKPYAYSYHL